MSQPRVTSVDRQIGARLRAERLARGLTQAALGKAAGVTFQQIQKYETGTDRLSASRLFYLAVALGIRPESFFEDLESQDA